jgi:hypothetical protein
MTVAVKVSHCSPGGSHQVITDNVEVDAFRRRRRDVGRLSGANNRILRIRMRLGTRGAQPITKIEGRSLIETNDVGPAAIDREIARAA